MFKKPSQQVESNPLFYIGASEKAVCVAVDDKEESEEIWVPKMWKGEEVVFMRKGTIVTIFGPEDLLFEKGLI